MMNRKIIISCVILLLCVNFTFAFNIRDIFKKDGASKQTQLALESNQFNCTVGVASPQCNYHGTCVADGKSCICNEGYVTFKSDSIQCNYEQKDTVTAFLLAFFVGVEGGAGYFYLGNIGMGIGQLLLFWIGMIPQCFSIFIIQGKYKEFFAIMSVCYTCLWSGAVIAWWITSLVMIATGSQHDGNGAPIPKL